jgi:hypothetical protein
MSLWSSKEPMAREPKEQLNCPITLECSKYIFPFFLSESTWLEVFDGGGKSAFPRGVDGLV